MFPSCAALWVNASVQSHLPPQNMRRSTADRLRKQNWSHRSAVLVYLSALLSGLAAKKSSSRRADQKAGAGIPNAQNATNDAS